MRCSVKTKLILFAVLIFSAAAAVFSYLSYSAAKRSAETVAISVIDQSAVSAAETLSGKIEAIMSVTDDVSKDIIMLRAIDDARINQLNVKNERCLGSSVTYDAVYSDTLRSIDGTTDYSDNIAVQNAAAGTAFFSAPYEKDGKIRVCFAAPFDYRLQSGSCVVLCIADSCFINETLASISLGDSCSVYLADENGIIAGKKSEADGLYTAEATVDGREGWRICVDSVPAELMPDLKDDIMAVIGFAAFFALIFCIVIAVTLGGTRSTVSKLSKRISALAEGDFTSPLPKVKAHAEYASIAESLDKAITSLNSSIHNITSSVSSIAEKDISEDNTAYSGELAKLHNAVSGVKTLIRDTLGDIRASSETMLENAEKIRQSRAENIVVPVNTENTDIAEPDLDAVCEYSEKTAEQLALVCRLLNDERAKLSQLTEAVLEINGKNSEIAGIAEKIDDIAFRTNFLALNAAIEASAAGKHGRAFAVVADEVRGLSQQSSEAAKSTSALVKEAIASLGGGADIAAEAEKILGSASRAAEAAKDYLDRLDTATEEYSNVFKSGAAERNTEIVCTPTFDNSGTETIVSEAERLKKIADSFKV